VGKLISFAHKFVSIAVKIITKVYAMVNRKLGLINVKKP